MFGFCLQDDSNQGNVVFVNAITGDYLFCSSGMAIASGRGTLTVRGCQFGIDHTKGNRKVHIGGDTSANNGNGAGTAFIQKTSGHMVIQITDKNMSNNTCSCSPSQPPVRPRDLNPLTRTVRIEGRIAFQRFLCAALKPLKRFRSASCAA